MERVLAHSFGTDREVTYSNSSWPEKNKGRHCTISTRKILRVGVVLIGVGYGWGWACYLTSERGCQEAGGRKRARDCLDEKRIRA